MLRYTDGHAFLARETRSDPVDVDTDRASDGWTNWAAYDENKMHVQVKQERNVWPSLRPGTNSVIDLSTPSPSPKKRKTSSAGQVPNPDNAVLGLPDADADEAKPSVEEALEEMMDALSGDEE